MKTENKNVSLLVSSITKWFQSVVIIELGNEKQLADIYYEKDSNIVTLFEELDLLLIPFLYKNASNERIKLLDLFFENSEVKLNFCFEKLGNHINKVTGRDHEDYRRVTLLDDKYDKLDGEILSFFKILSDVSSIFYSLRLKYKENTELKINTKNISLKWHGTTTEFMELTKALIESNTLRGKQKEIINNLSNMFNFEVKTPDQVIQDIKNRNIGSETLFLDKLKTSLFDYIKK